MKRSILLTAIPVLLFIAAGCESIKPSHRTNEERMRDQRMQMNAAF